MHSSFRVAVALVGVSCGVACSSDETGTSPRVDASPRDGSPNIERREASVRDRGAPDVSVDHGVPDAGMPDASLPDGAPRDARMPDAAGPDAKIPDASGPPPDGSAPDATPGAPQPTTALVGSNPADGATSVPRTTWVRLDFAAGLLPLARASVTLDCGPGTPLYDVDLHGGTTFVVNPRAPIDPDVRCTVRWLGPTGSAEVGFTVAPLGAPAILPYDRNDLATLEPFPDDFYLVDDAATRTGHRMDVRVPTAEPSLGELLDALITPTRSLDGMSPLAPIVVALPAPLDPASVPRSAPASLDPFASLGLFDIDAGSTERGHRVPFDALLRDETNVDGSPAHTLIVFPSVALRPRGRYAFVVTNRALVSPSRPLEASSFFRSVLAGNASTPDELRLAPTLEGVLGALADTSPRLHSDDLALALGISVRSVDDIPSDLLAVRETVQAAPPPSFTIVGAAPDGTSGGSVAAIVHGTWFPPDWSTGNFIARDAAGRPTPVGTITVDFTLALPKSAPAVRAPIIVFQHGQPGNADREVPEAARAGLAAAGFAVIGFTDVANRDIIPTGDIVTLNEMALVTLLQDHDLPDYLSLLTHADQLAFLRMIPTLGSIDVLPLGAPDGTPDLDPAAPLGYFGISQGSVHGTGLLAFAPEIHAAALTVGAGRFSATLVHQTSEALYQGIGGVFPTLAHGQFYAGISLVQAVFDRQDPQNLARHLYREPLAIGDAARASILMTEGLGDTLVPFYSTRSGASEFGIPELEPPAESVVFLPKAVAPLQANMDSRTTAAFFQYVPSGYIGAKETPGCVTLGETEGHFCAQAAAEAVKQRVTFFTTALLGAPQIADP